MSLVPMMKNPDTELSRDAIYFHYPHYHHSRPAGAIRENDWKLIEFFDDDSLELYNLSDDIGETRNLAQFKPDLADRLQNKLATWRKKIDARMPTINPSHDSQKAKQWWSRRTGEPLDIEAMKKRYETKRDKK